MPPNTENQASRTPFFDRPGGLEGIDHQTWSKTVSSIIDRCISKKPNAQFYNPSVEATGTSRIGSDKVRWLAFPKNLEGPDIANKWEQAEDRNKQDEYCEWVTTKNAAGKVTKVTFTCEVPEYWEQLATENQNGLTAAYETVIKVGGIRADDLFQGNNYNRDNKWNYNSQHGTIVHMRTKNNTLDEAVDLAADATIIRMDDNNKPITKGVALLAQLGTLTNLRTSQRRHSDPVIMEVINNHARKGRIISVDQCPGLYIDEFDSAKFKCPRHGDDPQKFWKVTRGTSDKCLRAEFEVPPGYGYVVGDIRDPRNALIKYGSQLSPSVWIRIDFQFKTKGATSIPRPPSQGTPSIYQYIEGRDIEPFELDAAFVNETLGAEWFGKYLSGKTGHTTAKTFSALLEQLPAYTWRAYAADEGIGINFNKERERVRVRLVVFATPDTQAKPRSPSPGSKVADIKKLVDNSFAVDTIALVSVPPQDDPTNVDSPKAFLQVASFSSKLGRFHFYDRERSPPGRWLYFGSSEDAFTPDTYGLGVFCGHANGGIVMKELDEPWVHWHTPQNQLELPDNHALRRCSALLDSDDWNFGYGEDMARMVQRGNKKWFDTRLKLDFGEGVLSNPAKPKPVATRIQQWMAHFLLMTSVNIRVSTSSDDEEIEVPKGFFFNIDALKECLSDLEEDQFAIVPVPRHAYDSARKKLALRTMLEYGSQPRDDREATDLEAQYEWKVLVPSAEDIEGIKCILGANLLTQKEATALLMVDFWNPIYSWRRAQLMRYVPSTARYKEGETNFGCAFTKAVQTAAEGLDESSPEAEYIRFMNEPGDPTGIVTKKLRDYSASINKKLRSAQATTWVEKYLKVAESKRRMFRPPPRSGRPSNPLAEFEMALPYARKMEDDLDPWEMTADGGAAQVPTSKTIWHPRTAQAHFSSSGCPFASST